MEFQIRSFEKRKDVNIIDELTASKQRIIKMIGRDFNKSVCNIIGLLNLLKDEDPASEDFKNIQKYLSKEASHLHTLVENECQ